MLGFGGAPMACSPALQTGNEIVIKIAHMQISGHLSSMRSLRSMISKDPRHGQQVPRVTLEDWTWSRRQSMSKVSGPPGSPGKLTEATLTRIYIYSKAMIASVERNGHCSLRGSRISAIRAVTASPKHLMGAGKIKI